MVEIKLIYSLRVVVCGQALDPPTFRAHFAGQEGRQQGGGKLEKINCDYHNALTIGKLKIGVKSSQL